MPLRKLWIALIALWAIGSFPPAASTQAQVATPAHSPLSVMPLPMHATPGNGQFVLDGGFDMIFTGYKEPRLERAKQRFFETLMSSTDHG